MAPPGWGVEKGDHTKLSIFAANGQQMFITLRRDPAPDESSLPAADEVVQWDIASRRTVRSWHYAFGSVVGLAASSDGNTLAVLHNTGQGAAGPVQVDLCRVQ